MAGAPPSPTGFVGRGRELATLVAALDDALAGRGRLALLEGEPGIGKSRLADELARLARERGAEVLWGRCWEAGGAPAYWPWVQALRGSLRGPAPEGRSDALPDGPADLSQLLPGAGGADRAQLSSDPEQARFLLFEAAVAFLDASARLRPLVLVMDDLHAADRPSLLLLRFVAGEVASRRILVVGALRDLEIGPDHPLAGDLAELGRAPGTLRLTLAGLARAEVAEYLELAGAGAAEALAAPIHRETAGNPLYVAEVVRLLDAEGRLDEPADALEPHGALPRSLRDAIDRRLDRLPDDGRSVLALASVLGREFELDVLAALAERTAEDALEALEAAMAARLVGQAPGSAGRLRFSHALVREALYEELTPLGRARLHRRAAEAIEARGGGADARLAELAHHFSRAALAGGADRALDYGRRAGERALEGLAYEEAARLYELALRALDAGTAPGERTRCELLLALGDAHARAGSGLDKAVFRRAADIAKELGWADGLARAALGYGGRFVWLPSLGDPVTAELLESALAALGEADAALRARLLARLAATLRDDAEPEPRTSLALEAVEVARGVGDPATLAYALDGSFAATWGPEDPERRVAAAAEIIELAERVGDRERALQGHLYRMLARLELGDIDAVRLELGRITGLGGQLRQPAHEGYVAIVEFILATFEGRFAEARTLLDSAREGRRSSVPFGSGSFWEAVLRRQVGPLDGLDAIAEAAMEEFPTISLFACQLPVVYAEVGREDDAREALGRSAGEALGCFRVENDLIPSLALLAEACAALAEAGPAEALHERLLPYAERNAVWHPAGASGSVSRQLGLLAALLGRTDEAVDRLEAAIAANARMGARPWVAHAEHDLARVLLSRDLPGDRARAEDLARRAAGTAERLGMAPLAARVASLSVTGRDAPRAPEAAPALMRPEGEYWTVSWEGRAFRLRDSKGLRYLARLLAHPGREVHALDLVAAERGVDPEVRGRASRGADELVPASAGGEALLDATARASYRARLDELDAELEEARAWGDPERAARAQEERDVLVEQLSGALGLGGRPRAAASDAERARVSVTRAIRAALGRLAEGNPDLGGHLERTVSTGTFCRYAPDPRAPVSWRL